MQSKWISLIVLAGLLLSSGCKSGAASSPATPSATPAVALPSVTAVPRDAPWTLPLPAGLTADQVTGVTVRQGDQLIPVTAARQNQQWVITPMRPYARGTTYTVRIYAADDKRYEGTFTTQSYQRLEPGQTYQMEPVPDLGFHFAYFLYIPPGMKAGSRYRLLVEPIDSVSASDSADYHAAQARRMLEPSAPARVVANTLTLPVLVPAYPWPADPPHVSMQSLSRATLQVKQERLARIDLQLAAMIRDAGQWLAENGIQTEDRIFLDGYGTAGLFADRFTLLHPGLVQAVAFGGTSGVIALPAGTYQGQTLRYPVGTAGVGTLTGSEINPEAAARVPRFVYLQSGENQNVRDLLKDPDIFEPADANLIQQLFGAQLSDRWTRMQQAARDIGVPAQFATYPGADRSEGAMADVAAFFRSHLNNAEGGTGK